MATRSKPLPPNQLQTLCDALLTGGVSGGVEIVDLLIAKGQSQRSVYLHVLTEAARTLGTMWDEDKVTFLHVHVATIRIENIIRETAQRYTKSRKWLGRSAVFAPVPGDEHTIGLKMATEIHRAKGWNVQLVVQPTHDELVSLMVASPMDILGLSIGSSTSMSKLYSLVRTLKANRPSLKILVCGSLVAVDKKPFLHLGVDAFASTLGQAERQLDKMARHAVEAR